MAHHPSAGHGSPDDEYVETPPGSTYEHTDAETRPLVRFLVGCVISAVVIHFGLAGAYQLLGARIGWKQTGNIAGIKLGIYAGADNLLDENYSLGNDINANGGRYYNPAARRNYYAGLSVQWLARPVR